MGFNQSFDFRDAKEIAMLARRKCQRFVEQGPERSADPIVRRYIETDFLPLQNSRTQFIAHQIPQNNFLPPPLDSE